MPISSCGAGVLPQAFHSFPALLTIETVLATRVLHHPGTSRLRLSTIHSPAGTISVCRDCSIFTQSLARRAKSWLH